uniref:Uncharacterized protein n=1 Tax=Physcomitrium patens TaxID=3218 RepID=A0A7I3ZSC1_PHYPA
MSLVVEQDAASGGPEGPWELSKINHVLSRWRAPTSRVCLQQDCRFNISW